MNTQNKTLQASTVLACAIGMFVIIAIAAVRSEPVIEQIEMEVTAYCPCEKCCGDWADGHFADGSPVGGKAIAADTRYYPMGTVFDVPGYGVATVKDRGGAIKGDRLDLYFGDIGKKGEDGYISGHDRALEWGRQFITVEVIE